jgi:hypothetical protein
MGAICKLTKVQTATVAEMGKLTYLHTMPYDFGQQKLDDDYRWNVVVSMMLTFDHTVHAQSFHEAMVSRMPAWMNDRMLKTDDCILLPIRYEGPIVDMPGFLSYWANRLSSAYRDVRCQRAHWVTGADTSCGLKAFRSWTGMVYFFINAPAYDEFGSNKLIHTMDYSEVLVTGLIPAEELAALPTVTLPPNFFD